MYMYDVCIYIYIYIYIPRGPTDLILRFKTHNSCSTHLFSNVTFMLNINHNMQHVVDVLHGKIHIRIDVGCQWGHGYLN